MSIRDEGERDLDAEIAAIHNMSESELREDLIARGENPDAVIDGMRRLGRVMAAKYASQIEQERRMPPESTKSLFVFPEVVAAGQPAWAEAGSPPEEATILDVLGGASKDDTFWARVRGWSMRDEGIKDGDLVLVNAKQEAKDGDIVLAHLAGEGQVVKRLRSAGSRVRLESANPDFAPIEVSDPSALRIHGVVVGRAGKV